MPWFTPEFYAPPPPAPPPQAIYQTYVPPALTRPPARVAPVAQAPVPVAQAPASQFALPPSLAGQNLPFSLRKVIYLSRHRQTSAQSVIEIAAAQIGWRVDLYLRRPVAVPENAGLVWMSGSPPGAPAIYQLWRLGVGLGSAYTINIDAAAHVITFMKAAG